MKKYTKQQIFDYCDAYSLAKQEGLVDVGSGQKFFDKFLESLLTIGTLVRNNEYHSWNRKDSPSFHTWLIYDNLSEEFILNPRRDDDWSTTLVDKCLSFYTKSGIEGWVEFVKSKEYAENVTIISEYYTRTGTYFRHYINRVGKGESLDKHSYERFVNNKFASKVLTAHRANPCFPIGSLVDFRANHQATRSANNPVEIHKKAPQGMLILSNTETILSSCKGAKRYKVVCIGESQPFWTEERYLKKRKKKR